LVKTISLEVAEGKGRDDIGGGPALVLGIDGKLKLSLSNLKPKDDMLWWGCSSGSPSFSSTYNSDYASFFIQ
jgi:hypothetical protein